MSVTDLPIEQRRRGLAADILEFSVAPIPHWYQRTIQSVFDEYERETFASPPIPDHLLLMWFADAWSIVRNMHTIAQLMRKADGDVQIVIDEKHEVLFESCTLMRNSMDHVVGAIQNHAKKTSAPMSPLLGTLTASIVPDPAGRSQIDMLDHIVVTRSAWHHRYQLDMKQSKDEIFPIKGRVANLRLHAFGQIVNLSTAAELARTFHAQMLPLLGDEAERRLALVLEETLDNPLQVTPFQDASEQ